MLQEYTEISNVSAQDPRETSFKMIMVIPMRRMIDLYGQYAVLQRSTRLSQNVGFDESL